MSLKIHCQQAIINLRASKMRSFLAVLGILVGTAAVVALLSSGQLATEKALEQFKTLGTDLLAVSLFEKNQGHKSGLNGGMSIAAWQRIPTEIPEVLEIAPYGTTYQNLSFRGHILQGSVIAADERLAHIIKIDLDEGRFVSFLDTYEHYCVIGSNIAATLRKFTNDSLLGKQIKVGSAIYIIIGVSKTWTESGFFNDDVNQSIIIPLKGLVALDKTSPINNAIMLLKPDSQIDPIIEGVKRIITQQAPKLTIFPRSAKQIIASMESQGQIFTLLLAVIGSISLLVGGIGVMNIMLVSVSERKKEIGIRKAVGAKNREIQMLFLVESVILALCGGLCGVLLGIALTWLVAFFSDWSFKIYFAPAVAGFAVSALTGVFFGYYPAKRAAKLEPMVSLRSE